MIETARKIIRSAFVFLTLLENWMWINFVNWKMQYYYIVLNKANYFMLYIPITHIFDIKRRIFIRFSLFDSVVFKESSYVWKHPLCDKEIILINMKLFIVYHRRIHIWTSLANSISVGVLIFKIFKRIRHFATCAIIRVWIFKGIDWFFHISILYQWWIPYFENEKRPILVILHLVSKTVFFH